MRISEHFDDTELIPKDTYKLFGVKGMRYINSRIPIILEIIRAFYGKAVIINTWNSGGSLDGRCLRLPNDTVYRQYSCHSFGNAVDFNVAGVPDLQVQSDILNNKHLNTLLVDNGVSGMEDGTKTWTHLTVADLSYWTSFVEKNGIKLIPIP